MAVFERIFGWAIIALAYHASTDNLESHVDFSFVNLPQS
jgi:hypothetical protein